MKRARYQRYDRRQTAFDFSAPAEADAAGDQERAEQERQAREYRERAERERKQRQEERERQARAYRRPAKKNPFDVLGVQPGASQREIRTAWIALVQRYHPDHGGDAAMFREVQGAYESLRAA